MYIKNHFFEALLENGQDRKYDCVLMFSGGKDSSYLLWMLKKIYNKNVIAVTIDNGFEHEETFYQAQQYAAKLEVPHVIYHAPKELFKLLYKCSIKESEKFGELRNVNHVCVICSFLLWIYSQKFAEEQNVPLVISGFDPAQINSIYNIDEIDLSTNLLVSKAYRLAAKKYRELLSDTLLYKENEFFQGHVNNTFSAIKGVKTIFPFIYLDYDIQHILDTVKKELGWTPPKFYKDDVYYASGCRFSTVISEIERLNIINVHERSQVNFLKEKGMINGKEYRPDFKMKEVVVLEDEIYDELEIKKFLIEECKRKGIPFKC